MHISLSESESEIMRYIWARGCDASASEVAQAFTQSRGWKIQTVGTFLTRLVEKGVLTCQKQGKQNRYSPTLSEADYRAGRTRRFLDQEYGGSVKGLVAALRDGDNISRAELDELKDWLESEAAR